MKGLREDGLVETVRRNCVTHAYLYTLIGAAIAVAVSSSFGLVEASTASERRTTDAQIKTLRAEVDGFERRFQDLYALTKEGLTELRVDVKRLLAR